MSTNFFNRERRWLEVLLAMLIFGWLGWRLMNTGSLPDDVPQNTEDSQASQEPIAAPDLLMEKFDLTAFRTDIGPSRRKDLGQVRKWNSPIRIKLHGKNISRYRKHIGNIADELSRLSGLQINIVDVNDAISPNVHVHLASLQETEALMASYSARYQASPFGKNSVCLGAAVSKDMRIYEAYAIIKNYYSEKHIRRCFIEEIAQTLGLFGDSEVVHPSIFSNDGPLMERLPLNDKILVRALYDPRITPGMEREDVMEIARELIPELVRRVKAEGVEALYQR